MNSAKGGNAADTLTLVLNAVGSGPNGVVTSFTMSGVPTANFTNVLPGTFAGLSGNITGLITANNIGSTGGFALGFLEEADLTLR